MANVDLIVANPTPADVTVNGKTAKANALTKLTFDNTTADAYTFAANGCAIASSAGATMEQREQIGFLFESDEHDIK